MVTKSLSLKSIFFGLLLSTNFAFGGGTFTFRIQDEPETLDWNKAHSPIETNLIMNMMEGLVAFDSAMRVIPALAQSWTISRDGLTYTFKLRKGVEWSDGVPLKAQHFLFSWKRLLSQETAAPYAYFLFDVEGAEEFNKGTLKDFSKVGISAPDDYTFKVKLKRPLGYWIDIPTFWVTFPIREDQVANQNWAAPKKSEKKMATIGPFMLKSREVDSKIILSANPKYYDRKRNPSGLDEVHALIVRDDSTALNLYETGKLDFLTDLSTLDIERLSGRKDLKIFPYLKTGYLGFVVDKAPLDRVELRRAIAMSIDKTKIPKILKGGQSPASSFCPPNMMGFEPKVGLKFNPRGAREALAKAGIVPSKLGPIELITNNWDKPLRIAELIQGELKTNLGLEVKLKQYDHKSFRAQLNQFSFPLFQSSWAADYPDPDNFLSVFLSDSGNNRTRFGEEAFDKEIIAARSVLDPKVRIKTYVKLQKVLIQEKAVIVPLYYEPNMGLVRAHVSGLELNPLNYLFLKKVRIVK